MSDGVHNVSQAVAVSVTPVNDIAPVISTTSLSVAENQTAVGTVVATDADLPGDTLTYTITGGADAAKFTINPTTGALSFVSAPDYETPTDAGADNVYNVTVQVSDGVHNVSQAVAVSVTPVNDIAPVISTTSLSVPYRRPSTNAPTCLKFAL